jgi:CheY-like chemotaxis protein
MASEPSNRRSILFVDDDAEFLKMIERVMSLWSHEKWKTLTANSASAALALLQNESPTLIVIDVCMPIVDGLQFLSIVHRRYPDTQKVVLTGYATEAYRTACLANGAELFLEKPRSPEGLESIFATLDELTKWKPEAGFRGVLRRVGLTEVIQMECLNQSSSVLKVTAPNLTGHIYISGGAIIHADAGSLNGAEAVYKLLSLAGGEFNLNPYVDPPERTVDAQWEFLLMEAAQKRDEAPPPVPAAPAETAAPRAAAVVPMREESEPGAVRVEELMICSEAGDVLHAWECPKSDLRINFLEFISQKASLLRNALPLGVFDRVEFTGPAGRFIAHIAPGRGIIVRTATGPAKLDGSSQKSSRHSPPSPPPSAAIKSQAESHFQESLKLAGLLAGAIHFSDGSGSTHSLSTSFPKEALDILRRSANDAFRVLQLQGFAATRARWIYDEAVVECALWRRGACLALALSKRTLELDARTSEEAIENFIAAEPKP